MNVQVVAAPDGTPLWFSRTTPGRTHGLTAARSHGSSKPASWGRASPRPAAPTGAPAPPFAPLTCGHRDLLQHYQQCNRDRARLRAPGERASTRLKSWQVLRRARCSTRRTGRAVQAVHVLPAYDHPG